MTSLPKIEDFDDPDYDPFLAEEAYFGDVKDIYAPLRELRKKGPVHKGSFMTLMGVDWPNPFDGEVYAVVGYDEASKVLMDYKSYSNFPARETLGKTFGHSLTVMDPPEHSRYRRLFQKAFLPQNVSRWGDTMVGPVVNELIDSFIDRGEADLIDEFTKRYPFEIIYRQLALPEGDGPVFHRLAVAQNMVHAEEGREAARKLGSYFESLLAERRKNPGDDLASALITATVDGEYLPDDVVISFLRQLINAAGDTTFRGTSVMLTGLLQNPDQLDALREDRSLMPQAIEEALRWENPVSWTERGAVVDSEVGGMKIAAGSILTIVLPSANHDERYFDDPMRFDIFRKSKAKPMNFAVGPHMCIGMHLARLEITRALNALLDRLPNIRLDPDKPGPVVQGAMLRYPKHLYVKFG